VRLYHSTDDDGRTGIEANGFAVSHNYDSAGMVWFSDSKDPQRQALASRVGWWVVVDVPTEVAAKYQSCLTPDEVHTGCFKMPWDVANAYRPFSYERSTDVD
jgi:hypothetical protein